MKSKPRDVSPENSDQEPVTAEETPKTEEDEIFIAAEDDIPTNTDKSIDFDAQLEAYKKRTTSELPYTLT